MIRDNFLTDVIYNHEYLAKVLGLLRSIKTHGVLDQLVEECRLKGIEADDHVLQVLQNEVRNYVKFTNQETGGILEAIKDSSSSNMSEELELNVDSDESIEKNKTVRIYADGVFDLTHSGHFNAMRQAKRLGDVLVVGINSDEDVFRSKGCKPIYTEEERGELMRGCKWVDEVVVGTEYHVSMSLLEKYKCDYAAHGNDISCDSSGNYCYAEVKKHNHLKIFERSYGISTTSLIKHLLQAVERSPHKSSNTPMENGRADPSQLDRSCSNRHPHPVDVPCAAPGKSANNINNHIPDALTNAVAKQRAVKEPGSAKEESREGQRNEHNLPENFRQMKAYLNRTKYYMTASRIFQFISNPEKKKKRSVIYVDGSFDIFHVGHLRILENAKKLGDFLLVGIHDDEVVRKMKGEFFPVVSLLERTLNVLSMKVVDDVVIGAPWFITESFIKLFSIDVVVRGTKVDYIYLNNSVDPYTVPKAMNIYRESESESSITTFEIIQRIEKNKKHLKDILSKRCKNEENIWKNVCSPSQLLSKLK